MSFTLELLIYISLFVNIVNKLSRVYKQQIRFVTQRIHHVRHGNGMYVGTIYLLIKEVMTSRRVAVRARRLRSPTTCSLLSLHLMFSLLNILIGIYLSYFFAWNTDYWTTTFWHHNVYYIHIIFSCKVLLGLHLFLKKLSSYVNYKWPSLVPTKIRRIIYVWPLRYGFLVFLLYSLRPKGYV